MKRKRTQSVESPSVSTKRSSASMSVGGSCQKPVPLALNAYDQSLVEQLNTRGYCIVKNFIRKTVIEALGQESNVLDRCRQLVKS